MAGLAPGDGLDGGTLSVVDGLAPGAGAPTLTDPLGPGVPALAPGTGGLTDAGAEADGDPSGPALADGEPLGLVQDWLYCRFAGLFGSLSWASLRLASVRLDAQMPCFTLS